VIYEYKCQSCEKVQEVWQKMSDPAPKECVECHSIDKLERVISKTSFALKGSGWYTTDYKKSNSKSSEKAESPAPACAAPSSGCGAGECAPKVQA